MYLENRAVIPLKNVIKKLLLIFILFNYNLAIAQQGYIVTHSYKGDKVRLYLEEKQKEELTNIDKSQILNINHKYFLLKLLRFPQGNADIMSCCEEKKVSWEKNEIIEMEEKLGKPRFDSLANYYSILYKKIKKSGKKWKKIEKSIFFKIDNESYIQIYSVDIEVCDCIYYYTNVNDRKPLHYECYVKSINKLKKIDRKEKVLFKNNMKILLSLVLASR